MSAGYIVWDTKTGINDGAYTELSDAIECYVKMKTDNPKGAWVIVQWIHGKRLAKDKFHAIPEVKE
jgi:hypothetical protein